MGWYEGLYLESAMGYHERPYIVNKAGCSESPNSRLGPDFEPTKLPTEGPPNQTHQNGNKGTSIQNPQIKQYTHLNNNPLQWLHRRQHTRPFPAQDRPCPAYAQPRPCRTQPMANQVLTRHMPSPDPPEPVPTHSRFQPIPCPNQLMPIPRPA